MEDCLEAFCSNTRQRISLWLPESFEFLILKSGLIVSPELARILEATSDYVDSERFESWERFFYDLLVTVTANTLHPYSKDSLHPYYLTDKNAKKILAQFPDIISQQ